MRTRPSTSQNETQRQQHDKLRIRYTMIPSYLHYYATVQLILTVGMLPIARGVASLNSQISSILDEYDGVGLTGWSVNGEGNLCSLGDAGERIHNSGESFVTTGDSRHHIGSVTKSITSTLLAVLVEDGTIPGGWTTKLRDVLPVAMWTEYENVTLGELVSHVSGIARDASPDDGDYPDDFDITDTKTFRRILAEAALFSTPVNEPGKTFLYSNWGYIVASHIIETLTGTTWEDAVSKRLFLPLGIDLGDDPSDFTGAPNNEVDPWGHAGFDQVPCDPSVEGENPFLLPYCDFINVYSPAAGFSGPVAAMAKYFAWHIQCHNGEIPENDPSASLLSQQSCQAIHRPFDTSIHDRYGYGWECTSADERFEGYVCSHGGSNDLNLYEIQMAFDMDRAFVAYTNSVTERFHPLDYAMLNATINATLQGDQDCRSRIPSSIYTTMDETSGSGKFVPERSAWFLSLLSYALMLTGMNI